MGLPDLSELPGWARKLVMIKNWMLLGIVILVVIGFVAEDLQKHRRGTEEAKP